MLKKPSIYLETTIFNFPFVDDAPQYKAETLRLFKEIKNGKFKPYTSEFVIYELKNTKDEKKLDNMLSLISEYSVEILPINDEVRRLADIYVSAGIIPENFLSDAVHIAMAAVHGLDFIISLNFKHIVKHKTILETEFIHIREGYKRIFIHTPLEVISHDENN